MTDEESKNIVNKVLNNKNLLEQTSKELEEMMEEYKDVFEELSK